MVYTIEINEMELVRIRKGLRCRIASLKRSVAAPCPTSADKLLRAADQRTLERYELLLEKMRRVDA